MLPSYHPSFQTHDGAMMASEALFSLNGGCGDI